MSEDGSAGNENMKYLNPGIPGLENILGNNRGFRYFDEDKLKIVIHGPAGAGKTFFALQLAMGCTFRGEGCTGDGQSKKLNAVYLTKDTTPETLVSRIEKDFNFFSRMDMSEEPDNLKKFTIRDLLKESGDDNFLEKKDVANIFKEFDDGELHLYIDLTKQDVLSKKVRIVFLDKILKLLILFDKMQESITQEQKDNFLNILLDPEYSLFFIGSLEYIHPPSTFFDKYAMQFSPLQGLGRLSPKLSPVFNILEESVKVSDELMIVCDSLPPKILEECLYTRNHTLFNNSGEDQGDQKRKPIMVLILESSDMPASMNSSFPPDIQIRMEPRSEKFGARTKTIQFLKARYQWVDDGTHPFVIFQENQYGMGESAVIDYYTESGSIVRVNDKKGETGSFEKHEPGITILPLVGSKPGNSGEKYDFQKTEAVKFGIKSIDQNISHGSFNRGLTLMLTESHCHTSDLGYHYLLGQIGEEMGARSKDKTIDNQPHSLLYIAVDKNISGILYDLWHYRLLRRPFFKDINQFQKIWEAIESALNRILLHEKFKPSLFKIPLMHMNDLNPGKTSCGQKAPYLYIFIPDFFYYTREELLERLTRLFSIHDYEGCKKCQPALNCLRIDRVLIDRVGRIKSRWPLFEEVNIFISNLIQKCNSRNIDLMIIDDTAIQYKDSGNVSSAWMGMAYNVIRLKRIPFRDSETVILDFFRLHNRDRMIERPFELKKNPSLVDTKSETERPFPESEITALDSFRGYTGLFVGKPHPAKVVVDLTYDLVATPLYRDNEDIGRNLMSLIDVLEVNLFGPGERPGIYSSMSTLGSLTHDRCHIVSVDEVWLRDLIHLKPEKSALASLRISSLPEEELKLKTPDWGKVKKSKKLSSTDLKYIYITEALKLVLNQKYTNRELMKHAEKVFAIPFRHNWGIIGITRFREDRMENLDKQIKSLGMEKRVLFKYVFFNQSSDKEDVNKFLEITENKKRKYGYIQRLHDFLWQRNSGKEALTWEDLRLFKEKMWREVFKQKNETFFGKKIYFFDLQRQTDECVVCFFLELLLSKADLSLLFQEFKPEEHPGQLNFLSLNLQKKNFYELVKDLDNGTKRTKSYKDLKKIPLVKAVFAALDLMYHLLEEEQRQQIGQRKVRLSRQRVLENKNLKQDNKLEEYEGGIAFISRQWITTVRDITVKDKHLNAIVLRPLPCWGKVLIEKDSTLKKSGKVPFREIGYNEKDNTIFADIITGDRKGQAGKFSWETELKKKTKNKGVPISGAWYLGVLSGGNLDLSIDILRELVSDYNEHNRFLKQAAAPVCRKYYQQPDEELIPYSDIVNHVYNNENSPRTKPPLKEDIYGFPFSRTRILNYDLFSINIFRLIKEVLYLPEFDEEVVVKMIARSLEKIVNSYPEHSEIRDLHGRSDGGKE